MQLFLDESGYSGVNLLDDEQPLFVLATIGLDETECKRLKKDHFGRTQMNELKHSALARRRKGRQMVLEFLDELLSQKGAFKFYMVHKKFALTRKFVDHIIEPALHVRGLNLYQGRKDISMAHAIYRLVPNLEGEAFFDGLLERFHEVLRVQTAASITALRAHLRSRSLNKVSAGLLAAGMDYLDDAESVPDIAAMQQNSLDLSLPIALPLMSLWRQDLGPEEPIHLFHDQSSAMAKQSLWWSYLTATDREQFLTASGAIEFPLGIDRTEFVKSEDWAGIQLADVVAGAFNRACQWLVQHQSADDSYGYQLSQRLHRVEDRSFMWIFPGETPEHLLQDDGNALNDYVSRQFGEFHNP